MLKKGTEGVKVGLGRLKLDNLFSMLYRWKITGLLYELPI
ncbi:MAG: hypothetical protein CM1200mP28_02430 [Deltaproteobacteria bacterium]|nr:MAG: hypothetical protein CM1200mP28_02430 [Deltaproteobacteria bacterium]